MRPVVCFVTGGAPGAPADALVERVAASARAGIDLVQVRERGIEGRALEDLVRGAVAAVRSTSTRIIVNERLDVALAAGAHGVHLRADSMPAGRVRAIVPRGFLIGRSVHDVRAAADAAAGGALDYLIFGTVFDTPSKPGREAAGVEALAAAAAVTPLPVLAIGGISVGRLGLVGRAGAMGFAAIRLFAEVPPERLPIVVDEARRAFGRDPTAEPDQPDRKGS